MKPAVLLIWLVVASILTTAVMLVLSDGDPLRLLEPENQRMALLGIAWTVLGIAVFAGLFRLWQWRTAVVHARALRRELAQVKEPETRRVAGRSPLQTLLQRTSEVLGTLPPTPAYVLVGDPPAASALATRMAEYRSGTALPVALPLVEPGASVSMQVSVHALWIVAAGAPADDLTELIRWASGHGLADLLIVVDATNPASVDDVRESLDQILAATAAPLPVRVIGTGIDAIDGANQVFAPLVQTQSARLREAPERGAGSGVIGCGFPPGSGDRTGRDIAQAVRQHLAHLTGGLRTLRLDALARVENESDRLAVLRFPSAWRTTCDRLAEWIERVFEARIGKPSHGGQMRAVNLVHAPADGQPWFLQAVREQMHADRRLAGPRRIGFGRLAAGIAATAAIAALIVIGADMSGPSLPRPQPNHPQPEPGPDPDALTAPQAAWADALDSPGDKLRFAALRRDRRTAVWELAPDTLRVAALRLSDAHLDWLLDLPAAWPSPAPQPAPPSPREQFAALDRDDRETAGQLPPDQRLVWLSFAVDDATSRTRFLQLADASREQMAGLVRMSDRIGMLALPAELRDSFAGLTPARRDSLLGLDASRWPDIALLDATETANLLDMPAPQRAVCFGLSGAARRTFLRVPPGFEWLRTEQFRSTSEQPAKAIQVYRYHPFADAGAEGVACEFVLIPGGTFQMGNAKEPEVDENLTFGMAGEAFFLNEQPVRELTVGPFLMARTEVTQQVWNAIADGVEDLDPKHLPQTGDRLPMSFVSWTDCVRWCGAAQLQLPLEGEWEYACRAGTTTQYYFGDRLADLPAHAWFGEVALSPGMPGRPPQLPPLHEVGTKPTNGFGLFNMLGNVSEWCIDLYALYPDESPARLPSPPLLPLVDTPPGNRVLRGGNIATPGVSCRSAKRQQGSVDAAALFVGFRPVRRVHVPVADGGGD